MRYRTTILFTIIAITIVALFITPEAAQAQCSLCKQALETSGDGNLLLGLKWSIVFMIIPPTLMTAGIGFLVIKSGRSSTSNIKNNNTDNNQQQL